MSLIDSGHSQLLAKAMDAYSLRQKITSTNIANVDTPGYNKHKVNFEELLQQAKTGEKVDVNPEIEETQESPVLENELIQMADTQLRFQLTTRALTHHFNMMRNGITSTNR